MLMSFSQADRQEYIILKFLYIKRFQSYMCSERCVVTWPDDVCKWVKVQ